jgi:hypothetical protein
MPRPGTTQCDNCSYGPLEKCTREDCHIKDLVKRMNEWFKTFPQKNGWEA